MMKYALLMAMIVVVKGLELTLENYDELTAGKNVFLKYHAPWCGHCKKMRPAWDVITRKFKDREGILIGDIDCEGKGKSLCIMHEISDFPTIRHGDPRALSDYTGGRDSKSLKTFAAELKALCAPSSLTACDEESKAILLKFMAMSNEELLAEIEKSDNLLNTTQKHFEEEVEKLQQNFQTLQQEVEDIKKQVEASGFTTMKVVADFNARKEKEKRKAELKEKEELNEKEAPKEKEKEELNDKEASKEQEKEEVNEKEL